MATSNSGKELQKKLKIKTGTAKRVGKELESYHKEAQKQEERINKLKNEGADEHLIKKQEEVLQDTKQMIPDTNKRIVQAKKDLEDLMASIEQHEEASVIKATEDWKVAQEVLQALPQN